MQNEMRMIGGSVLNRMVDLRTDVKPLWEASEYSGPGFRGIQPYSELKRHMMALSLGSGQEECGADERNDEEDVIT